MIVKLLEAGQSYKSAFGYNAQKCKEATAALVYVNGIPNRDLYSCRKVFEQYVSNPRISARTKKLGFHMAFNPGDTDRISEVDSVLCISDLMEAIGYGGQPYAVFRHNDIKREHFHIVSVNVRGDGTTINRGHLGWKVRNAALWLGTQYGFTLGLTDEQKQESKVAKARGAAAAGSAAGLASARRFNPANGVTSELARVFDAAVKYDFRSFYQFGCVMRTLGVIAERVERKDGGYNLVMKGLDGNDKQVSLFFSAEKSLGIEAYATVTARIERNLAKPLPERDYAEVRAEVAAEWCKAHSASSDEFRKMMRVCGFGVHVERNEDMTVHRVTLCDDRNRRVFETEALAEGLHAVAFTREESSKRWRKPRKRGVEPGEVRLSREMKEEIRDLIIERCEQEGVEVPGRVMQGAGRTQEGINKIK